MNDPAEMAERHGRVLARLTELALSMAEQLHADAATAADASARAETASAFHKIARTIRQTVALDARLQRDLARAGQEARKAAEKARQAKVDRGEAQVRASVERELRAEYEAEDAEEKLDAFEGLITELVLADDFLDLPVEVCIERIRTALGLPPQPDQPHEGGDPDDVSAAPPVFSSA